MSLAIRTYDGTDPAVYAPVAPFSMSRAVVKEFGGPVYTDARYRWVIASQAGVVVGFASIRIETSIAVRDWAYVAPSHRQRGVYAVMAAEIERLSEGRPMRATSRNPVIQGWLVRHGFTETGHRGAWKVYHHPGSSYATDRL